MSDKQPSDELLGQTIAGRYRIISRLGAGGMGVAYRAWDEEDGVPVVIKIPKKIFLEDPKFAERFAREIRLLQGLKHPHIVPIVDVGEHEGLPYVAMRFLPGGSLYNRGLRGDDGKTRPNPPGMLHLWLPAVADALDHVHANGVVHRDVKPANIFFDAFWGAFLGDFGIAKIVEESDSFDREHTLTATNMGIGTQEYMGPEQFTPKPTLDGRTDQYALAVTVYEMLAGTRPFTGTTAHIVVEVTTLPAPRLDRAVRGLPSSLVEAVRRGLAKSLEERFPTCRDFAAAVLRDVPHLADEPDIARLLCPDCAKILKLPVSAAGRKGKCPKCRTEMKVAKDLGALWLLDEARRQESGTFAGFDSDSEFDTRQASADGSLPEFQPVSGTTPIERAATGLRKGLVGWIDGHGLIVAAVLGFLAVLPWLVRPEDKTSELQALQQQLRDTAVREQDLTREVGQLKATRDDLRKVNEDLQQRLSNSEQKLAASSTKPASNPPAISLPLADLTNSIGIKLKLIPAGTFMMGSEDGAADEKPLHEVRITKPFYIGVYEVTNAEWKRVMGGEPPSKWKDGDRPVEMVSWDDAVAFCRKLSAMPEERTSGRVYRLPIEAEWEYACRAGTMTKWVSGDDEALLGDSAWLNANSNSQTQSTGQKKPNAWGLHDMHCNVWEWCGDWYGPYPSEAVTDPTGVAQGSHRVLRGGGWNDPAGLCRSASRDGLVPSYRSGDLGFRLAMSVSGADPANGVEQPGGKARADTAALNSPPLEPEEEAKPSATAVEILTRPPLVNSIGIKLKFIPHGNFMMGSEDGENDDEKPVHQVRITQPFYLGVTEVTNAQWRRVMGGEPPSKWKDDGRPVETVNWNDAVAFCQKLSGVPEEQKAGRVYRLPTEAEWEYACRAGTTTRWSSGDDEAILGDFALFDANAGGRTHPVGQKRSNPWGLHDMHGNVWEWCADWYGPYPEEAVTNPTRDAQGSYRVIRGGGWFFTARLCRSAYRFRGVPSLWRDDVGFRLALSASESMSPEAGQPGGSKAEPAIGGSSPPSRYSSQKNAEPTEILARPPAENSIGMKLKLIPPGTFLMGSNDGDPDEMPVHEVKITKPFHVGVYEVTNAQWQAVMGKVPSAWRGDDHPVEQVSWTDAIAFCRTLTALPAERAAGRVYRLPTEAEWEYACRAGTNSEFSFGGDRSLLPEYGWVSNNSGGQTRPVGLKKPNPWGLYDMHGNVWEWCADGYGPYNEGAATDPAGLATATVKVYRGGNWGYMARESRSAKRKSIDPEHRDHYRGFRVVMDEHQQR